MPARDEADVLRSFRPKPTAPPSEVLTERIALLRYSREAGGDRGRGTFRRKGVSCRIGNPKPIQPSPGKAEEGLEGALISNCRGDLLAALLAPPRLEYLEGHRERPNGGVKNQHPPPKRSTRRNETSSVGSHRRSGQGCWLQGFSPTFSEGGRREGK